jgi:hypothetical protein
MKNIILVSLLFIAIQSSAQRSFFYSYNSAQPSVLTASTGDTPTISGSDLILGGMPAAEGGLEPYAYQWIPANNLDDPQSPNPVFSGISSATYSLIVTDNRGCTSSDTIQIIITEIDGAASSSKLKVFPNPGSGSIQVERPDRFNLKHTQITLFDASGAKVFDSKWPNAEKDARLDVAYLSAGQYQLVLQDGKEKISSKIIIK